MQQLGSLVGIDHAALQQIATQRGQFGHRESVFIVIGSVVHLVFSGFFKLLSFKHGRHHLRFRP